MGPGNMEIPLLPAQRGPKPSGKHVPSLNLRFGGNRGFHRPLRLIPRRNHVNDGFGINKARPAVYIPNRFAGGDGSANELLLDLVVAAVGERINDVTSRGPKEERNLIYGRI